MMERKIYDVQFWVAQIKKGKPLWQWRLHSSTADDGSMRFDGTFVPAMSTTDISEGTLPLDTCPFKAVHQSVHVSLFRHQDQQEVKRLRKERACIPYFTTADVKLWQIEQCDRDLRFLSETVSHPLDCKLDENGMYNAVDAEKHWPKAEKDLRNAAFKARILKDLLIAEQCQPQDFECRWYHTQRPQMAQWLSRLDENPKRRGPEGRPPAPKRRPPTPPLVDGIGSA